MSSRRSRLSLVALPLAVVAAGCGSLVGLGSAGDPISLVTQDLGLGGDLDAVLAAAPADQPARADALWAQVGTAKFSTRVEAIAEALRYRSADVIGVQSAMQLHRVAPASGTEEVVADYLDLFVAALAARGLAYTPVATTTTVDLTLAGANGDVYRFTDREAILVREGVAAANPGGGTFGASRSVSLGGTAVPYLRGWVASQVAARGKTFRFVSTHLDSVDPAVQRSQAVELGRVAGGAPVAVVGNIGADPADPTFKAYEVLLASGAGLYDPVSLAGATFPTCCRDQACVDPSAGLSRRVDVIFTSSEFNAWSGSRVPGSGGAMTDGLWASPHAGVVVQLHMK
jgi:endonuclease/exonuclease/phosphatase family metal-dependent hydrolase